MSSSASSIGAPVTAPAPPRPGPTAPSGIGNASRGVGWKRRIPLLPVMSVIILVTQLPFLFTIYYSLTSWNLLTNSRRTFVWFANYGKIFSDTAFRNAAWNTAVITVGSVLLSFIIGLFLALLVNREFMGRGIVRTLMITPFLILPAATALLWKTAMLNASFGLINFLLKPFGVSQIDWVTHFPKLSVIVTLSWQWTPFFMLILLAGLQGEDPQIIEAAKVDGANGLKIFRYMTITHLRPYAELGIFLGTIYILQSFDAIYLMTQGGPGGRTTTLPYYLYLRAFRGFEIGEAAALAVVVLIATIVLATIVLKVASGLLADADGKKK